MRCVGAAVLLLWTRRARCLRRRGSVRDVGVMARSWIATMAGQDRAGCLSCQHFLRRCRLWARGRVEVGVARVLCLAKVQRATLMTLREVGAWQGLWQAAAAAEEAKRRPDGRGSRRRSWIRASVWGGRGLPAGEGNVARSDAPGRICVLGMRDRSERRGGWGR